MNSSSQEGGGKHQRIAIVTHNQTDQIEGMVFEVSGDELLHARQV